mmetsp:Transcript_1528/g.2711  ORF Transcript_1528/g.2711 Transcript_1528/m.2711 type:complete len:182 (+) Transcript_1528:15-560(+)
MSKLILQPASVLFRRCTKSLPLFNTSICASQRFASSEARSTADGVDFKTTILAGKISAPVKADMPVDGGGNYEHPSPKDLVMSGLAACTSMTLQTRASAMIKSGKLKEGDLTRVIVEAKDNTEAGTHMPTQVEVVIELEGALTEAQRRQLMASVKACPVKRMLQGELADGVHVTLLPREEQ